MSDRPAFGANLVKNITDRELEPARAILAVIGVLTIVMEVLALNKVGQEVDALRSYGVAYDTALVSRLKRAAKIGIAVGCVYLLCAAFVHRKPVIATAIGLALFCAAIVVQAAVDVSSLWSSVLALGTRIVILVGLVSAVQFARVYERNRKARTELPSAKVVS